MIFFWIVLLALIVFENIEPYFYKLIIENTQKLNWSNLTYIVFFYIGVRLSTLIFENTMRALGDNVLFSAARDARLAVLKKIHKLDFAYHANNSTGSLISLIKRGDGSFFDFFYSININAVRITIGFVIMLGFMLKIKWELALMTILSFGLALICARVLILRNMRIRKEFIDAEDEISEIIVDNLINFETVKIFAKEDWEQKRLENSFVAWVKKLWDYSMTFRAIDLIVGFIGNTGFAIILVVGAKWMKEGVMSVGDYIMVLAFIASFYGKFFELIYNLRNLAKNIVDIEKYFNVMKEDVKIKDPNKAKIIKNIKGNIDFEDVTFSYPNNKNKAIHNINLNIKAGESVAFVGHSGVGKTTIVKLIMRFFDPESGVIKLDGIDIKKLNKKDLRSHMGIVPQEPIMFNNSIEYNIAYGCSVKNKDDIKRAAKLANMEEFVEKLTEKYDTNVGERGVKLSGGQKQRLAIARMILKNPNIIIFDEATSQLDSESEKLIQDAFWKAAKGKTTIIIAHRLSTITKANKIVVMEKGQIKEVGSHEELLSIKGSLYSKFWKLQTSKKKADK